MSQIEVVALEDGHDGVQYRRAGERWPVPSDAMVEGEDADGNPGLVAKDGSTWYVPADGAPDVEAAKAKRPIPGIGPAKGSKVK